MFQTASSVYETGFYLQMEDECFSFHRKLASLKETTLHPLGKTEACLPFFFLEFVPV